MVQLAFNSGRQSVADDVRAGAPRTTVIDQDISQVETFSLKFAFTGVWQKKFAYFIKTGDDWSFMGAIGLHEKLSAND